MRVLTTALAGVLALVASAGDPVAGAPRPIDRQWQSGTWRAAASSRPALPRGARSYAIEAGDFRYEVDEVVPLGGRPLAITLGAPVKYAVDKFIVHVLSERGVERPMRLVSTAALAAPQPPADKGETRYPAIGGGHFIKAVRDNGRLVTLEDNSVWEIEPTGRYFTAQWEAMAGIAVRHSGGDDGFVYEIANLDRDEGASARWVRP